MGKSEKVEIHTATRTASVPTIVRTPKTGEPMSMHLLVYYSHLAGSGGTNAPIPNAMLQPIKDGVVGQAGPSGYYVPRGMKVIGAHAVGSGTKTTSSGTTPIDPLFTAQLFTPGLMRVGTPYIIPLQGAASVRDASNAPLAPNSAPVSQWLLSHGLTV